MDYLDLELNLTEEAKAMHELARKFGMEVMRPAGIELDKLNDPADVIAEGSVLYDVFKKYRELGFHKMGLPKALGGMREDMAPMVGALVGEELGYGDSGLNISLGVSIMPFYLATLSPEPEMQQLVRDFCEDTETKMIGCWAITEPDHGSDWLMGSLPGMDDPKLGPSLKAVLKGDEYILNGQKAAWVSNGTIATHACLHVNLEPSKGMHGTGIAIISLDLHGVTRGKPHDKMGQRPLNQGEIFFEDVKIPKNSMIIPDTDMATAVNRMILTAANTSMGTMFTGLAQAAFDEALEYAKERIQGGVPIIEHQNIQLKLFNMFTMVESARAFSRKVSAYNTENEPGSTKHAIASKILCTDTAFKVSSEAIQVFGGYGLSREYQIEKIFRDARAAMIEDGVNESLALGAAVDL